MIRKKIFVVEDEEDIQQLVSYNLLKAGFNVVCVDSGEEALRKMGSDRPDLIILDLMLPGMNGLEVCRALKRIDDTREIPVVMLTAKGEEADIVAGLELGADDYITKPFSPKVLIARVKTILRRRAEEQADKSRVDETVIRIDELVIDPVRHEVSVNGSAIVLTLSEFNILKLLAKRSGWVYTRQQIIDDIRGYEYSVTPRSVDVHVFSLRRKLGRIGKKIESVRGIGYRFRS